MNTDMKIGIYNIMSICGINQLNILQVFQQTHKNFKTELNTSRGIDTWRIYSTYQLSATVKARWYSTCAHTM